jgi:hypothetical protein
MNEQEDPCGAQETQESCRAVKGQAPGPEGSQENTVAFMKVIRAVTFFFS